MPLFISILKGESIDLTRNIGMMLMPLGFIVVFYFNFFILIDRYLFNKKFSGFIFLNILVILLVGLFIFFMKGLLPWPEQMPGPDHFPRNEPPRDGVPYVINSIASLMVIGVSVAIRMTSRSYELQTKMQQLEKENTAAELTQLKSQLNPHFLFNSLNNIYALIGFNPERAMFAVHSLGEMLRYQLYETSKERISIKKEMDFVKGYCDLMKLRLPSEVSLVLDIPNEESDIMIPPLLFISLIENAFKHGVNPGTPSVIEIKISVEGRRRVSCYVRNASFPKKEGDKSGSGIGLENLKKRLSLLYPNENLLKTELVGADFIARVNIPINNRKNEN